MEKILKYMAFGLMGLMVITLVAATMAEKLIGTGWTHLNVYGAWWFVLLWILTSLSALAFLFRRHLYKRPVAFVLHVALVLILVGALVTHCFGVQGSVHLRKGVAMGLFLNSEHDILQSLPFRLTLSEFRTEVYPGTDSPMDYVSTVVVNDNEDKLSISMNHIGEYAGWRFYQSGYDPDLMGTTLYVSYDPWGIAISYAGYALLALSMLLFMIVPRGGYRRLLSHQRYILLLLFASFATLSSFAQPRVLSRETAQRFGELFTYYNGRVCPMQTVAIDFTTKLYGRPSYCGLTAEQVLTGWAMYPEMWVNEPIIKVNGDVLQTYTGKSSDYLSYADFFDSDRYLLQQPLRENHHAASSVYRALRDADERLNVLQMLFAGELLRSNPHCGSDGNISWTSLDIEPLVQCQPSMLDSLLTEMLKHQRNDIAGLLPSEWQVDSERLYNDTFSFVKPLSMILLTLGILLFLMTIVAEVCRKTMPVWTQRVALTVIVLSAVYVLMQLVLRSVVSHHLPLSNGHETMLAMSLSSMVLTLCLFRKVRLLPSFGLILAGLTLLVAMIGQTNPQVTLLMPVLQSPLLSIHVCVIMIAYTLFAFIALNSIASLVEMRLMHHYDDRGVRLSLLLLYPALFLLSVGIFIGAVWANVSWGRYWGWDPKEVWALITMIIYAMPVHRESIRWFRSPRHLHLYLALAFLSVLITYFGVNFFLGGLHSYGNG